MSRKRLLWKVAPAYLAVTLVAMIAVGWLSVRGIRNFYLEHTREDLRLRALLLMNDLPENFPATSTDSLQQFCTTRNPLATARITLIAKDGRVLGDSDADPERMENHASHPEVKSALTGAPTFDIRRSITIGHTLMYYALPVHRDGAVVGVLRTAMPLTTFNASLHALTWKLIIGGIVVAVLAALMILMLSRRVSRPIVDMLRGAERFGRGELSARIQVSDTAELASLADTLNRMAEELDDRIRELITQRNEQQAILASMGEGVIAVDLEERILFVNRAAGELLGINSERMTGRLLQECVRNRELEHYVREMLAGDKIPPPEEIRLAVQNRPIVQLNGSYLVDDTGQQFGALLVLNDITRLRQLEGLRREFVANVSHELRTPIATIRGFVESLQEGAWADPERAPEFLNRISNGVERLNNLVDDLLRLSRIETEAERSEIALAPSDVYPIVQAAVAECELQATEHKISVVVSTQTQATAMVNAALLEQAVVNLLDNAIKYSEPGQQVNVEVIRQGDEVIIQVRDKGCGISAEHLPRIFERFYRVDKARSRKLGSTGLGLAIVKHIVQAHRGRVSVESEPGEGSSFSICLPAV